MLVHEPGILCACGTSDHLGNHTQLLKHGQVIRKAALFDNLTIAQTKDSHIAEGYRFACGLYAVHGANMRALDQKLHDNVFTAVDEKFYLFTVVRKPNSNACYKCFDPLNTNAPVGEGIVSKKVFSIKLFHTIDLAFSPDDVAGFSDDVCVVFHWLPCRLGES